MTTTVQNTSNTNDFFNFTAAGTGYINDIRVVNPKNSQKNAFISVKVAILEGKKDDVNSANKTFADLIVRGKQAEAIINAYKDHWPSFTQRNGNPWVACMRIGSLWAKTYTHNGETKVTLAGRLLKITYLKIGETVIQLDAFEQAENQNQPTQQPASQPVQQVAPQPVQQAAPQPVRQAAPQPVRQAAPQPVQQAAPQPVQQAAPQPVQQAAPQPVRQAAPQPVRQAAPQPVQQIAPQTVPQPA